MIKRRSRKSRSSRREPSVRNVSDPSPYKKDKNQNAASSSSTNTTNMQTGQTSDVVSHPSSSQLDSDNSNKPVHVQPVAQTTSSSDSPLPYNTHGFRTDSVIPRDGTQRTGPTFTAGSPVSTDSTQRYGVNNNDDNVKQRKAEIVKVTEELLTSIAESDWDSYQKRCDATLSCFEPESIGNLVTGMSFHRFYFDHAPHGLSKQQCQRGSIHTSILNPHVILLGENSAVIAYIRMTQYVESDGTSKSKQCEESRVWQLQDDNQWRCVHFHRSSSK